MDKLLSIKQAASLLGVNVHTLRRWHKEGKFIPSSLSPGGHRYYALTDIEKRMNGLFQQATYWAQAVVGSAPPLPDILSCQTVSVFQYRLDQMAAKMKTLLPANEGALLVAIVGEVGDNSFAHNLGNWLDVPGVYFGYNLEKREIVLADRGRGVLATLKRVRPSLLTHEEALKTAFTEVLSGRAPEPRGNGLKFVRETVAHASLTFSFMMHSGNAKISFTKGGELQLQDSLPEVIHGTLTHITF